MPNIINMPSILIFALSAAMLTLALGSKHCYALSWEPVHHLENHSVLHVLQQREHIRSTYRWRTCKGLINGWVFLLQSSAAQWDHEPSYNTRKNWTPQISSGGTTYEINSHNVSLCLFLLFWLSLTNNNPPPPYPHPPFYWLPSTRGRANMPQTNSNQNLR